MNDLYKLLPPSCGPSVPHYWSFSSLSRWRECPRRWWLTGASYPNVRHATVDKSYTAYPEPMTVSALRGTIVHDAVEAYIHHIVDSRQRGESDQGLIRRSFHVRSRMRESLDRILAEQATQNPRTDANLLRLQVTLDECVNLFKRALRARVADALPGLRSAPQTSYRQGEPRQGAEVVVTIDNPRIRGRLDYVGKDCIVDFKTGEANASHVEQLEFYALLWWLTTGRPPQRLSLVYLRGDERIDVPVPSVESLGVLRDAIAAEIVEMVDAITEGRIAARPGAISCARCPVRQLCPDYWSSPETAELRGDRVIADEAADGGTTGFWADVAVNDLPAEWDVGHTCIGSAWAEGLGPVRVSIGPEVCPDAGDDRPIAARVLSAHVRQSGDGWELTLGRHSEVFWVYR